MRKNKRIMHRQGILCRTAVLLLSVLLLALPATAGDLNKGYTFSFGERGVDHTKLNNLVDNATVNTTFFTDKSAETTPAAADLFLLYSSAGATFKKCSLDNILFANTRLITSQTEATAPATNDYVLLYSTANSAFRRATLQNAFFTNAGLIVDQPRSTNAPIAGALLLLSSNGVYQTYALTNLFQEWWRWMPFSTNSPTNFLLSTHTKPTNTDGLLIWDSVNGTNKATTLLGLVTNLPIQTYPTNGDFIPIASAVTNANNPYGTNPTLSQISVTNLLSRVYTSALLPCDTANGVTTLTHGLPGTPNLVRPVLVLTNTARLGYSQNDEIDIAGVYAVAGAIPSIYSVSPGATTITLAYPNSTLSWGISRKDTGVTATITKIDWNVKVYAYYFQRTPP